MKVLTQMNARIDGNTTQYGLHSKIVLIPRYELPQIVT